MRKWHCVLIYLRFSNVHRYCVNSIAIYKCGNILQHSHLKLYSANQGFVVTIYIALLWLSKFMNYPPLVSINKQTLCTFHKS